MPYEGNMRQFQAPDMSKTCKYPTAYSFIWLTVVSEIASKLHGRQGMYWI